MSEKRPTPKRKGPSEPVETPRSREAVLADFRKIAGPLRGQNRDRKAKS